MLQPFNIMAKPVCGVCNLDCRYCYYCHKPRELYPDETKFQMSDELLESYTRQYMQAMPVRCEFGWQGGEPMLAGKDFFRKAIEFQKQYGLPTQTVANALQTNATLVDDEWCEFLAENKFLLGVSLDGPPRSHDYFRVDHAGKGSWHRAWAGLDLLIKHKVEFNVLVTLNSINAAMAGDLYRYFVNRGVQYLQFIPVLEHLPNGDFADYCLTPQRFGRFMLQTFEQWLARDVGRVSERFIDNVLHTLIYGRAAMCCFADRCANAHVLEYNGDLYVCDHFVCKEWKIGNILERPLEELLQDPRLEEFAKMKTQLPDACRDCEYLPFCNSGCPKHHVPIGTSPERRNYFCESYKIFFKEALGELTRVAEYIRKGQLPPAKETGWLSPDAPQAAGQAPGQFPGQGGLGGEFGQAGQAGPGMGAQQAAAPTKPPGRNEPCSCGSGRKFKSCCGRQ